MGASPQRGWGQTVCPVLALAVRRKGGKLRPPVGDRRAVHAVRLERAELCLRILQCLHAYDGNVLPWNQQWRTAIEAAVALLEHDVTGAAGVIA